MNEVLHANVFFLITSIAVIAFTILLSIALFHVIKILASVRRIIDRIEAGSEVIAEDMHYLRNYFKEGSLISQIIGIFFGTRDRGSARKSSGKKRTIDSIRESMRDDINEA